MKKLKMYKKKIYMGGISKSIISRMRNATEMAVYIVLLPTDLSKAAVEKLSFATYDELHMFSKMTNFKKFQNENFCYLPNCLA